MVEEALAGALPGELRELVVARSEGNPFFIEELVGTLIDHGVLERSEGSWRLRDLPPGFAMPDSIHAVLAARIDLLPPLEKAALQTAAVMGRIFWAGPVGELLEGRSPTSASSRSATSCGDGRARAWPASASTRSSTP